MEENIRKELINYLAEFTSDNKKSIFEKVLNYRTRHLTVVLENTHHSQNSSAVIRTCDCFGVQDVHVIEKEHEYLLNTKVLKGSAKWVNIHKYESSETAIQQLKQLGYSIVATSPKQNSLALDQLPINKKTALVFGTELDGISDEILSLADDTIHIPMYGFTESFNLSVSAAICIQSFINKLHQSTENWKLSNSEKELIRLNWLAKSVARPEIHLNNFFKERNIEPINFNS